MVPKPRQEERRGEDAATRPVVFGYARVSSEGQDLDRQKAEIYDYASRRGWAIERIIKAKVSSRKSEGLRGIDKLKMAAEAGEVDVIVFSELSRLGRSVGEIARLIDFFVKQHGVACHFVKESMVLAKKMEDIQTKVSLCIFSLLAEIERDLISERTKDGLAARRAAGVKLGRPALQSKLDPKEDEIRGMVEMGVKQKFIAKKVECTEATLSNWLKRKRPQWKSGSE